jgi:hypothetical protein
VTIRVRDRYGLMEGRNVPAPLRRVIVAGQAIDPQRPTFFLSRER